MSDAKQEIWLVRHGETEWSRAGRHTGKTDVALTPRGRREAEDLARRLRGRRFALVLTSPLRRALDTCRIAGFGEAAAIDGDLVEWDYGVYEGRTTEDIQAEQPGWNVWTAADPPPGETVEQVGRRADRVIARAEHAEGDVLLFGHGHLLRILAARWLGLPADDGRRLALSTASSSVLSYEHDTRVVLRWNDLCGSGEAP